MENALRQVAELAGSLSALSLVMANEWQATQEIIAEVTAQRDEAKAKALGVLLDMRAALDDLERRVKEIGG